MNQIDKRVTELKHKLHVLTLIVLETNIIGKIQGIQFCGIIHAAKGDLLEKANRAYLKWFPIAMLMPTMLWTVDLTFIKMTCNRLRFGKKLKWESSLI